MLGREGEEFCKQQRICGTAALGRSGVFFSSDSRAAFFPSC
jgi:hypothetical protein